MVNAVYGIFGAGGFGREVLPAARRQLAALHAGDSPKLMFVSEGNDVGEEKNGYPVVGLRQFLDLPGDRRFNIAIADSTVRKRLAVTCQSAGATPFAIMAPTSVILDGNQIKEGGIFCDFAMVTSNAKIGRFFHGNIYSYVAHDCRIGDFVTFAPSVCCNGNVHIGDGAYIGTGALLKPGSAGRPLKIGEGAVIGMGAVVIRDVPPGATVVGNPARPLAGTD